MRGAIALPTGLLGFFLLASSVGFSQAASPAADSLLNVPLVHTLDQLMEELRRQLPGAQVARVKQGIRLTWATTLLFETQQAHLRPAGRTALDSLTALLQRYPHTMVVVGCQADTSAVTPSDYRLANSRARAVRSIVMMYGVVPERIRTQASEATPPHSQTDPLPNQVAILISASAPPAHVDLR